jgi:four helix bundle protein
MKKSFEEMDVRKSAYQLSISLGKIFYDPSFRNYSFQDQIMRASISVSNNIAEWNNRWSAKDFVKFLFISKGSCAEVRSMIYLAHEFGYITSQQKEVFLNETLSIINQLGKFISYLKTAS